MKFSTKEQILEAASAKLVEALNTQLDIEHVVVKMPVTAQFAYCFASSKEAVTIAPDTGFGVDVFTDAILDGSIEEDSKEFNLEYDKVAGFVEAMKSAADDNMVRINIDYSKNEAELKGILFDIQQFLEEVDSISSGSIYNFEDAQVTYDISDIDIEVSLS